MAHPTPLEAVMVAIFIGTLGVLLFAIFTRRDVPKPVERFAIALILMAFVSHRLGLWGA